MRQVDEANKLVDFWDNWIKKLSTMTPAKEYCNAGTESLIREVTSDARHMLADVGNELIWLYRERQVQTLRKFKLGHAEFQTYRAGLPWYRRALLLYKSPNPRAKAMKVYFHLYLWTVGVALAALPLVYLFRNQIRAAAPWIAQRNGLDAFYDAHPFANLALVCAYSIGYIAFSRQRSIKYENDPSYFPRDRMRMRYFEDSEEAPV
jgi:hypothetical protein